VLPYAVQPFIPSTFPQSLDPDEVKREGDRLQSRLNELSSTIQRISAPNMKAVTHLDEVKSRYHESKDQFDSVRKRAKRAKQVSSQ